MIVDFEPEHILELRNHEWQSGANQTVDDARNLKLGHCAFTALSKDGRPLICAGIMPLWPGRAMCWSSFDLYAKPVMVEAHRRTLIELDKAPFKRLEMYVLPGYKAGVRWAEMLGFTLESFMEAGSPDGRDILVFKRIKRGAAVKRLR